MEIRNIITQDYYSVSSVINEWWGGRSMTHLLPRLFFEYFQNTSFVIKNGDELVGFLVGFIAQSNSKQAYIHFVGVNPNYRKQGYANQLYNTFIKTVKENGCKEIHCITTPINTGSIAFHEALGFQVELIKNYAGEGQDRIVFSKVI